MFSYNKPNTLQVIKSSNLLEAFPLCCSRLCLKCDGTRAETRFCLSAKRTSPFKSAWGRQFSRLLAGEVCASAVVMLDTPCVEIKCHLDATEVFIADIFACSTCFGHHYAHHQELKSIIQWLLPVVIGAVIFQVAGLVRS